MKVISAIALAVLALAVTVSAQTPAAQAPARARRCFDERQQPTSLFSFLLSRCGNVGDPDSTYEYVETVKVSEGDDNAPYKQYDISNATPPMTTLTSVRVYYAPQGKHFDPPSGSTVDWYLNNQKTKINIADWTVSQTRSFNLNGNPSLPAMDVVLFHVVTPGSVEAGHYSVPTIVRYKQYRIVVDLANQLSYDITFETVNGGCDGDTFGKNCQFTDNLTRLGISTQ
jgi:hypothetical protein